MRNRIIPGGDRQTVDLTLLLESYLLEALYCCRSVAVNLCTDIVSDFLEKYPRYARFRATLEERPGATPYRVHALESAQRRGWFLWYDGRNRNGCHSQGGMLGSMEVLIAGLFPREIQVGDAITLWVSITPITKKAYEAAESGWDITDL